MEATPAAAPAVITYEAVAWMQLLDAANTNKKYFMVGHITSVNDEPVTDTLAVTEKGGSGGTLFYCQKHRFVFSINHGVCEECQKQVVTAG
jgi:hypothetical protein